MFTRFSTIHERDGQQKDGQTRHDSISRAYAKHRATNSVRLHITRRYCIGLDELL